MNENVLSCTQTTLGLNSPCEICRQPSQARPLSLKIFILSFIWREDTKTRSTDIKEQLQEDRSSTWFSLSETASKLKKANSCLLKMCFCLHSLVKYILKQRNLCGYLLSVWYYAFCTLNLHRQICLWVVFLLRYFETELCWSKAGRSSLFHQIISSRRFLP